MVILATDHVFEANDLRESFVIQFTVKRAHCLLLFLLLCLKQETVQCHSLCC